MNPSPPPPKPAGDVPPPPPPPSSSSKPAGGMDGGRKKTAWMTHVKATMRAHKGLKLKQILKLAKKTYKKTMRGGRAIMTPDNVQVAAVGGRRRRGSTRRSRARRGGEE